MFARATCFSVRIVWWSQETSFDWAISISLISCCLKWYSISFVVVFYSLHFTCTSNEKLNYTLVSSISVL